MRRPDATDHATAEILMLAGLFHQVDIYLAQNYQIVNLQLKFTFVQTIHYN